LVGKEQYGQGWARLARELNDVGRRVREEGLAFAYHNHAFEFELEGGRPGLDILFENTDPELVQAQIDVAWVRHAGVDPADLLRRLKGRVPLVHLKDITDSPEQLDVVAGGGLVDWDSVLAACAEVKAEFGTVEMDHPPQPALDAVRACHSFFHERGLS
jgi:sugar phosphate isomerase/epimerase